MARASNTHRASLLLVLACAARAGAAGIMDALDIKAVCEVPADGPRKIYLDMDSEAFETLAGPPGPGNAMSLPIEATDCEPFKSAYINFSPGGHPAWDGKGDGYGIDHFDIHFYTITEDARTALMGTCVLTPGAGNCDASAPENAPFARCVEINVASMAWGLKLVSTQILRPARP